RFATRFLFLCALLSCLSVRRCDWSAFRPFSLPISIHAPRLHPEFPIPRPPGLLPPKQARRLHGILLPPCTGPARSRDPPPLIHSSGLVRDSITPSTKRRTHKEQRCLWIEKRKDRPGAVVKYSSLVPRDPGLGAASLHCTVQGQGLPHIILPKTPPGVGASSTGTIRMTP
uniref:Secreted protein n=1 Tax=Triticum urartu TaxID=4572 RepID=A0A8R7Q6Q1_TRIUA